MKVDFWSLAEARPVGGLRNVLLVVGSDGKVSIERNYVSLSPHVKKP